MGSGWQSGITSLVFLIASKAAARANSKISPLGTLRFSIAVIVACADTLTSAVAIALRSEKLLCVMFTILLINFPLMIAFLHNFPTPYRQFFFDSFYQFFTTIDRIFPVTGRNKNKETYLSGLYNTEAMAYM